jgi:2-dehydro-3-deoxyphosphogluconate aldolase / (4S)-4-hydroxy-2-oxoglutarate aldolase
MSTSAHAPVPALAAARVLPVVTIDDADHAVPLVATLAAAGLVVVEITLRTDAALAAIRLAVAQVPEAIVGAGTVTSASLARAALDAGACFLVSPGLDTDVVGTADLHGVPVMPGVATPTELQRAVNLGCSTVKLFPAEVIGGTRLVEALAPVWPDVRFVPTGGISPENAGRYLALPHVLAVGGSWMVPRAAVTARDWSAVSVAASAAARLGTAAS